MTPPAPLHAQTRWSGAGRVWRAVFWLQVALVTGLMLWPRPPPALDPTGWDKLNHAIAFAGPAVAGLMARARPGLGSAVLLLAGLLAWGGLLELLQSRLPPRQGDWADLLADAVGLAVGALVYLGLRRVAALRRSSG